MSSLAPGYALWLELALVLALGAAVIVALAAVAAWRVRSAVWQRTIWQVAALGIVGLLGLELFGAGEALVALVRFPHDNAVAKGEGTPETGEPRHDTLRHGNSAAEPAAGPLAEPEAIVVPEAPAAFALADSEEMAFFPDSLTDERWGVEEAETPLILSPHVVPHGRDITEHKGGQAAHGTQATEPIGGLAHSIKAATQPVTPIAPAWWPGLIWALGAGLIVSRIVWARLLLGRFRRRQALANQAAARPWIHTLARRMGIRRPVLLLESPGLKAPVAFGLLRPTLVLPASFAQDFSRQEQETILAHELAHLAARDPLWQLLMDLLCAALWWHPLAWWSRTRLRAASEAAADEASLLVPGGPDVLAACLVALGRKLVNSRRLGWLSIEGPGFQSGLGRRVARLLNLQTQACRAPAPLRLAIARIALPLALVVVSILSTAWARPQAAVSQEKGEPTMSVVRSSWQRSLAAAALAAWLGSANASPAAEDKPHEEPKAAVTHADGGAVVHAEAGQGEKVKHEVQQVFGAGSVDAGPHVAIHRSDVVIPSDPAMRELLQKRMDLGAKLRDLEKKLADLRDDQEKEAQEIQQGMRKVLRELRDITERLPAAIREMGRGGGGFMGGTGGGGMGGGFGGGGGGFGVIGGAGPMQERIKAQLEELHQRLARLKEAGKREEAAAVERQIAEMQARMAQMQQARVFAYQAPPKALAPEEREKRMRQVQEAAAKLREAGLPEQADRLMREAEAVFSGRQPQAVIVTRPGDPRMYPQDQIQFAPGANAPLIRPGAGMMPGMPDAATQELRAQMQQLQAQMQELRAELRAMRQDRPATRAREGRPETRDPQRRETRDERRDPPRDGEKLPEPSLR